MKLKIILYNVQRGFGGDNPPFSLNKKNMDLAAKEIQKLNPDILVLNEGYFWHFSEQNNLKNIKKLFNKLYLTHPPTVEENRECLGIAIFSKFKITNSFSILKESLMRYLSCNIKVNNKNILLDVFHPSPELSDELKYDLLKKTIPNKVSSYILAGDLNAYSWQDTYDKKKLLRGIKTWSPTPMKTYKKHLNSKAIKHITNKGMIDTHLVHNKFDYTIPTDKLSKNKDSAGRIDFIFASPDIKVLNSGIIKAPWTEKVSDHYPIYAEIEI